MGSTSARLPADLAAARTRIEKWRSTGRPRRRLPKEILDMAADLVPAHSVYRVSRALRLEYYKVKKQAETRQAEKRSTSKKTFVQVPLSSSGMVSSSLGCTVEVTDPSGRQLTVRSSTAVDVTGLVAAFCGVAS